MKDRSITYARKRIEKEIEFAERERKRKQAAQRLEMARAGISAYQRRRLTEAVRNFQTYIRILEEIKESGPGGLLPDHFDKTQDMSELLMISGIYWDLAKLYDRTRSADKYREFTHYLQKYMVFSRGMPYQHLCAEAVRKYLSGNKPVHREDFKNVYKVLTVNRCFVATSLVDVTAEPTIPILREWRDRFLQSTPVGRAFVDWYYRNGPRISKILDKSPFFIRKIAAIALDTMASLIRFFWPLSE